ncbi:MAG: tryptophan--tRNA ligase, partial [Candidatus Nanohaloarchaea archaeon]
QDDSELERIREEYASGEMLSGELKQIAKERLEEFLLEHQQRREEVAGEVEQFVKEEVPEGELV